MKITQEHYQHLSAQISPLNTAELRAAYEGLSAKRYRWDLLYRAGLSTWICDNLYPYLDDTHIDTALRSIVSSHNLIG